MNRLQLGPGSRSAGPHHPDALAPLAPASEETSSSASTHVPGPIGHPRGTVNERVYLSQLLRWGGAGGRRGHGGCHHRRPGVQKAPSPGRSVSARLGPAPAVELGLGPPLRRLPDARVGQEVAPGNCCKERTGPSRRGRGDFERPRPTSSALRGALSQHSRREGGALLLFLSSRRCSRVWPPR